MGRKHLTPSEKEQILSMKRTHSYKQIMERFNISKKTVYNVWNSIDLEKEFRDISKKLLIEKAGFNSEPLTDIQSVLVCELIAEIKEEVK